MTILGKAMTLACLALATGSAAQIISAPTIAASTTPSAVIETTPSTQALVGTLFFGQQQRDRMDRERKGGTISADGVSNEAAPAVLNGFVKRSDGRSAIWVDGQLRYSVQNEGMRRLQPSDVGGSADTVKVLVYGASTIASVSSALPIKKAPLRKTSRKRPAKTR